MTDAAPRVKLVSAAEAEQVTELFALAFYLESSNRANDRRYERLGFMQVGTFAAPGGEPTAACMWREPRQRTP